MRKLVFTGIVLMVILSFFYSNFVFAQSEEFTYVISNSEDWRDVYSVMHYANLKGVGSDFLVSTRHGSLLLFGIDKQNDIRVISSETRPFVLNYPDIIKGNGFEDADEIIVESANLELIEDLPEIENFIIVGNSYGYNVMAVAPYATKTKSWVFFADETNIDEIDSILSSRDVNNVLIYGFVERGVRDVLEKYDPEIINTGDRFSDNVEIVKKFIDESDNDVKQVVLSNGEFIERGLMQGMEPVLFTGKENVPEQIADYLKSSDIEVGVLIGSDLVGAATNIRRTTGISVIVKFARGARRPTGAIAAVEGLDLFYLPIPILELELHSVRYNRATSQLEVTYHSGANVPMYLKGTLTPKVDGEDLTRIGDVDAVFIAPNDFKTVVYPDMDLNGDDLKLGVFALYGETPTALEKVLETEVDVDVVNVIDSCDVVVEKVSYHKPKEAFKIKLKNLADVDCWVDVELVDVIIDGSKNILGNEGAVRVESGKTENVFIDEVLTEEDLKENDFVETIAYYGEKENSLVKIFKGKFELSIISISGLTISIISGIIILIILLILFVLRRRKEDEDF